MEKVLEVLEDVKDLKTVSMFSSNPSDRLRLTVATFMSLRRNIREGQLPQNVDKYNATYAERREAIYLAETSKAENEVKKSIGTSQEQEKISAEDAFVLTSTSELVVHERSEGLGIELGTLSSDAKVTVRGSRSSAPKPLRIENIQYRIYRIIGKKVKMAQKVKEAEVVAVVEDKTPSWKKLFPENPFSSVSELFIEDESNSRKNVVIPEDSISAEELQYKRMIGKIHDELLSIRKRMKNSTGFVSPFERGLAEREAQLLEMLAEITGVDFPKSKLEVSQVHDNSAIQDVIDDVVGYVEPKTEEERKNVQKELDEYYSDPEVLKTIDRLRHKDVLFAFNSPEAYESVMRAEQKADSKIAEQAIKERLNTAPTISALTPEETLKAGQDQAKILFDENQFETFIQKGALEQAEMLKKRNDFIDKKRREEQEQLKKDGKAQALKIYEKKKLINGAEEEAKILLNKAIKVQKDAEEKARAKAQEEKELMDFLLKGADLQAAEVHFKNGLLDSARQEAERIHAQDALIAGAQTQAEELYAHDELLAGAQTQAEELHFTNEMLEAAEEEAIAIMFSKSRLKDHEQIVRQIVYSTASDEDIINGAREQAEMLAAGNQRLVIEQGALEQAKLLAAKEVSKENQGKTQVPGVDFTVLNCRYPLETGKPKPIKLSKDRQFQSLKDNVIKLDGIGKRPSYKDQLRSIRDQLDSGEFDFLKLSDDLESKAKAA